MGAFGECSAGPIHNVAYTRRATHSPTMGKTWRTPSDIFVENVHFDWFNRYLCTGEHFQSDLDIHTGNTISRKRANGRGR